VTTPSAATNEGISRKMLVHHAELKSKLIQAYNNALSSRTQSRAFSFPPQFGGRGTQRGICF